MRYACNSVRADEIRSMNEEEATAALHAGFKDKFQKAPEAARITLRAQGSITQGGTCRIETNNSNKEAGLHPAMGGDGLSACAGDMLLEALVACAGVTLTQVARAMEIELRSGDIDAEGGVDFRGSLGLSKEVPVGLQNVRLHFHLDSDATEEQLAAMVRLTERFCVVSRTLNPPAKITYSSVAKGTGS